MKFFFSLLACCIIFKSYSQSVYKKGDIVENFSFGTILNNTSAHATLNQFKNDITIIDFFGTWCIPCVKALPHLDSLQNKFNKVSIILVSNEEQPKLSSFITARKPFTFPVVIDQYSRFTSLFQPPSYPYTIVIDKGGKIIAVTDAASVSEAKIDGWLKEEPTAGRIVSINEPVTTEARQNLKSSNPIVELSQQFIYAAKTKGATDSLVSIIKNLSYTDLKNKLISDEEKKAFWINLYNGYTQMILQKDPGKYKSRNKFFKAKQIEVAGKMFSLDEIEHGILRHSKIKWSLGYFNKLFPGKTGKDLRVDHLDYRIHFALNCGAKSCPPIAFYNPENLNTQLNVATKAYLTGEANYDTIKNTLYLPTLMGWFRGDFGRKKGMTKLAKKINIIPAESHPKIKFKKYDWNLFLNHYKTDN